MIITNKNVRLPTNSNCKFKLLQYITQKLFLEAFNINMQINSTKLYSKEAINKPQFKGNMRQILRKDGMGKYWTTTYYFRSGFNWDAFIRLIISKYKKADKVNIIDHACSCGAESDTLTILLTEKLREKANKFFPIIAKDINSENIKMAKENKPMNIDRYEVDAIEFYTGNIAKYFDIRPRTSDKAELKVCSKPFVRKNIKFSKGNIFEDIDNMPKANTVLLCRNMWIYLSEAEQQLLAQKICTHFDSSSLIALGEYDLSCTYVKDYFRKNNFVQTSVKGVFRKKKESTFFGQTYRQVVQNLKNRIQKLKLQQRQCNKN